MVSDQVSSNFFRALFMYSELEDHLQVVNRKLRTEVRAEVYWTLQKGKPYNYFLTFILESWLVCSDIFMSITTNYKGNPQVGHGQRRE